MAFRFARAYRVCLSTMCINLQLASVARGLLTCLPSARKSVTSPVSLSRSAPITSRSALAALNTLGRGLQHSRPSHQLILNAVTRPRPRAREAYFVLLKLGSPHLRETRVGGTKAAAKPSRARQRKTPSVGVFILQLMTQPKAQQLCENPSQRRCRARYQLDEPEPRPEGHFRVM